ncbi:MAG: acyl carrier protein [Methylocystis sp.]|nr:acyl carrier protein [Methylocystis sp.]MBI3276078.1 acyl carrier protein [Methylocystis sp.]
MADVVRQLIDAHGELPVAAKTLAADADLYRVGLTSFAAIRIMLALEDACGVEFPARMLRRQSFISINSIVACLQELQQSRSKAA